MVGISALSVEYKDAVHRTFAIIKKANPKVKTIIGGVYPSISPDVAKEDENIAIAKTPANVKISTTIGI